MPDSSTVIIVSVTVTAAIVFIVIFIRTVILVWRRRRRRNARPIYRGNHKWMSLDRSLDRYILNLTLTRNTFCGTWYLPHSQVHNDPTVPIITVLLHMFSLRMHETAKFPLTDLKSDAPVCSATPISVLEISPIWPLNNKGYIAYFHRAYAVRNTAVFVLPVKNRSFRVL